ncbi:MAG: NAD(P)-dependent oxidoreductase [Thermoguttaceae bacterium]|jgi:nucleoside-diphosphate-sugar epimerase|nr:NAD(P)-dependent oxidoreductase [Thermoguttaceae bacterium]
MTSIADVEQLEDLLSRPTPEVVETMRRVEGDLMFLGVGGKIGPTLARMARRASDEAGARRRVYGVARFSDRALRQRLESWGIETIACDLLDRDALARLPEVPNLYYLAAMKFGTTGQEDMTWAMNTYLPGMVCERFPKSRLVSYSTGNVYPLVPAGRGGSVESDPLAPVGEYGASCLGRERILAYFSRKFNMPVVLLRLNYAQEPRYGILVDIAQQVLAEQPVDVTMGYFNAIWQGDSNAMTLRAIEHAAVPPRAINLAGPEELHVRHVAAEFGRLFGKPVRITGSEAPDALLSNGRLGYELLGRPTVTPDQMMRWIADWLLRGGVTHGKPTKFQARDGRF